MRKTTTKFRYSNSQLNKSEKQGQANKHCYDQ